MVKSFNMSVEQVLYQMSYPNLIMYASVLATDKEEKGGEEHQVINADDPKNRALINQLMLE